MSNLNTLAEILGFSLPQIAPIADTVKNAVGMAGFAAACGSSTLLIDHLIDLASTMQQERYENRVLSPTELLLGYRMRSNYRIPIIVDMKNSPHMFVCGLSQQGKTRMVEAALKNKQCVLLNCFDHDFQTTRPIIRTRDMDLVNKTLETLVNKGETNTEPLFVVVDEVLDMVLAGAKSTSDYITRLLATAAHNKIYLIAISQTALKDSIKFKNLFNTRVCFRMRDEIDYKTALGYTPEVADLETRDFFFAANEIGKGHTYDV